MIPLFFNKSEDELENKFLYNIPYSKEFNRLCDCLNIHGICIVSGNLNMLEYASVFGVIQEKWNILDLRDYSIKFKDILRKINSDLNLGLPVLKHLNKIKSYASSLRGLKSRPLYLLVKCQ